ncbi:mitochondrial import receptor subunit TOM40 homolog [Branchiostoma floridae x Branchiostoma belcheri]
MGNVLAAGPGPTAGQGVPNLGAFPPPPPPTSAQSAAAGSPAPGQPEQKTDDKTTNPGTFDELHKKCKEVFPNPMEGCKLVVNKGISNHFQVNHTISLCAFGPSSYHFGATYVGTKQISPSEAYPVLLGDIDTSGSLNAQMIHQITNRIRTKAVVQTQQSKWAMVQLDADYRGDDYTASVTLGNPDFVNESGIVVAHYLQRITKRLALGAELLYHHTQGQEAAIVTVAGRYTGDNWIATGNLGGAGCHASYYHQGNEYVQVGVEFEANLRAQESAVSLGYQLDVPKANMVFRGMLDSNWTVAAVLEKKLQPLPFTFMLSGMLNHTKNQARFGFGLLIG